MCHGAVPQFTLQAEGGSQGESLVDYTPYSVAVQLVHVARLKHRHRWSGIRLAPNRLDPIKH